MRKLGSFLCLLVAVAAVIFMFLAKDAKGYRVFYGLFSVVEDGTFMSFIGNIFGVLLTVVGFGMAGLYGLSKDDKKALIGSAAMCGLCLLSFIIMLFTRPITIGDFLIIVPPAMILISLLKH